MKPNIDSITLIYNVLPSSIATSDGVQNLYQVNYVFSERGMQSTSDIASKFNLDVLEFDTLEGLGEFAKNVLEKMNLDAVKIISNVDFNEAISFTHDQDAFKRIFDKYATVLNNQNKKESFFKKMLGN